MTDTGSGEQAPPVAHGVMVYFDKVGRVKGGIPFLQVASFDPDVIADKIHKCAGKYLMSGGYGVEVDLAARTFRIYTGSGAAGGGTMDWMPLGSVPPEGAVPEPLPS